MAPTPTSVVVTASMPEELVHVLREHARRADRSLAAELRIAARKHAHDIAASPELAAALETLNGPYADRLRSA